MMNEMENITNAMNDILSYEKAFKERRARMDANKCRYCGEIIGKDAFFCNEKCEQNFCNTANAEELRAWDAKNGIEPVKNIEDERAQREETAGDARREKAFLDEQISQGELKAEAEELVSRPDWNGLEPYDYDGDR